MMFSEIGLKQKFFLASWVISSIFQTIGIVGFAVIIEVVFVGLNPAFIFWSMLALFFSPLVDVVYIEGKRNKTLEGIKKPLAIYGGMGLSFGLSALSVYVFTAQKFGTNVLDWNGFAGSTFAFFLLIQGVIFGVQILFLDDSLNAYFGEQGDEEINQIQRSKAKAKRLSKEFNLPNEAAEKLDILAQILDQQSERNAQVFAEIFQILAGMRGQIETIENRPMPKLSAPPSELIVPNSGATYQQKLIFLMSLKSLIEADAFTVSKLEKVLGLTKKQREEIFKQVMEA